MTGESGDMLAEVAQVYDRVKKWSPMKVSALAKMIAEHIDDERNLLPLKTYLSVGMQVYYLSPAGCLRLATVVKTNRTRLIIRDDQEGKSFDVPFHIVNPVGVGDDELTVLCDVGVGRADFKVGDEVRFPSAEGPYWISGCIIKRNPKTATVECTVGHAGQYRVSYHFLEKTTIHPSTSETARKPGKPIEPCRDASFSPAPPPSFMKRKEFAGATGNEGVGGDGGGFQTPKKGPSRNGPCPCGSAKKYKRCCGK